MHLGSLNFRAGMYRTFSKSFSYRLQAHSRFLGKCVPITGFNSCVGLRPYGGSKGMLLDVRAEVYFSCYNIDLCVVIRTAGSGDIVLLQQLPSMRKSHH